MSTADTPGKSSRLWLVLLPIIVFAGLAALFWKGLSGTPNEIPSALIDKPVPDFVLNPVDGMKLPGFADEDLKKGKVTVINVWASWCAPCRIEHPLLTELAKRPDIQLFGMNYKDEPPNEAPSGVGLAYGWAPTAMAAPPSTGASMACRRPSSSMARA